MEKTRKIAEQNFTLSSALQPIHSNIHTVHGILKVGLAEIEEKEGEGFNLYGEKDGKEKLRIERSLPFTKLTNALVKFETLKVCI